MPLNTDIMSLNFLLMAIGLVILIKGSDWFIDGAAAIAHHFKIPDAIVGLTLVSIGTSLPELATNVYASATNNSEVALGNVTGSNIANVMLILGVAVACLGRIPTDHQMFHRDARTMLILTGIFGITCYAFDSGGMQINRIEGIVLLATVIAYTAYLAASQRQKGAVADDPEHPSGGVDLAAEAAQHTPQIGVGKAVAYLVLGGFFVVFGAKMMVDNVVWVAEYFKIPKAVISATVVAFGTSLPELAVTIAGIMKKKNDIAMGNIVGSNIYNIGLVMACSAIISPVPVDTQSAHFVIPVMIGSSVTLVVFMRTGWSLLRWEGIAFLIGYVGFLVASFLL